MRSFLLTLVFTCSMLAGFAQTSSYVAIFSGTKADLEKAIASQKVIFSIGQVANSNDADLIQQRSTPYVKEIGVTVTYDKGKKSVSCTANLDNAEKDMKWLFRFFMNANIQQVTCDGKTVSAQEFFQPWF